MAGRKEPAPLSAGQLEIMNVIWDLGEVSVAEVWEALSGRRKVARNTVLTLMTRLEQKGWLCRRAVGSAFRSFPGRPRVDTQRSLVRKLVDTAFAGSADGLVMALLEGRGVSEEEAGRIRALIERAEGRKS